MSKYQNIYQDLYTKIQKGVYPAGTKLPGEMTLMKDCGASRETIRKALSLLAANGYIHRAHGVGSIVLDIQKTDFPVSAITSFKEVMENTGKSFETNVISLELTEPDARFKKELNITDDTKVWLIRRQRVIDGEAVILDTDVVNAAIIPNLTVEICQDSLYHYLENTPGLQIACFAHYAQVYRP